MTTNNKTAYQIGKDHARDEAITWSEDAAQRSMSWGELVQAKAYFERLGRRYGLLREFRENCIC